MLNCALNIHYLTSESIFFPKHNDLFVIVSSHMRDKTIN